MVRVCHFVYDCVGEEIVGWWCDEEIKRVAVGVGEVTCWTSPWDSIASSADDERDVVRWDEVDELTKFNDEWWFAGVKFEAFKSREIVIYFRWFNILSMDDCDAAPALVGEGAAMLVGVNEAVWSEAICDAARSVGSYPNLGQDKDIQSSIA